jgi:hypothetical protein
MLPAVSSLGLLSRIIEDFQDAIGTVVPIKCTLSGFWSLFVALNAKLLMAKSNPTVTARLTSIALFSSSSSEPIGLALTSLRTDHRRSLVSVPSWTSFLMLYSFEFAD